MTRHRRKWLEPAQVCAPEGVCVVLGHGLVTSGAAAGLAPGDDVDLDLEIATTKVRPARHRPRPPDRLDAEDLWVAVVGTLKKPADAAGAPPVLDVGGLCISVIGLITALDLPDADRVDVVGLLRARSASLTAADPAAPEPWGIEGVEEVAIDSMDAAGHVEGEVRQLLRVPAAGEARPRCLYVLRLDAPLLDRW